MNSPAMTVVRRVLVVDDSPDVQADFRKVLTPHDVACEALDALESELFGGSADEAELPTFALELAGQGREALEIVKRAAAAGEFFAMAFVDVRMPPGWDGLETIRRLWEVDPGLEIVVCTAYSDHSWRQILSVTGHTDQLLILKKPFQVDEARQLALALSTKRRLKDTAQARREDLERLVQARTSELERQNRELEHEIAERRLAVERLARANRVRGRQARALSVLLALSQKLAVAEDTETAIDHVMQAAARLTRSRRVSVMLPDRDGGSLRIAASLGLDPEIAKAVRVPIGSGIAGRVFADRAAVVANNALDTTQAGGDVGADEVRVFASVPLISRALVSSEQVVGVLNVSEHQRGRPYSARELRALDMICNMAATAIGNILTRRARDDARESIVTALATLVECRDDDTGRHLDRVTGYSLILAGALRDAPFCVAAIDAEFLRNLRRAVPLHDIGKVGIPDEILHKPDRLSEDEMAVMRRHTEIGEQTIRAMTRRAPGTSFLSMAAEIAIGHHERFDGGGYPHGVAGETIPLAARIAAVADVYDALTTARPYKQAYSHERAVEMIVSEAGRQFDPVVIDAFSRKTEQFLELARQLADPVATDHSNANAPSPSARIIDDVVSRL